MSSLSKETVLYAGTVGATVVIGAAILRKVFFKSRASRNSKRSYAPEDQDVVIFHSTGPKGMYTPSPSPPCEKLQNYLRMARIPHRIAKTVVSSPKGKVPWIELNGEVVSDSSFCIDFLNEKYKINLNRTLSEEQKAVGRAFQKMLEENTYWAGAFRRWLGEDMTEIQFIFKTMSASLPWIVRCMGGLFIKLGKKNLRAQLHAQGMGRHTPEEIENIAWKDISAVSVFLGKKDFFFGDEPCEYDCTIFAYLAKYNWQLRSWGVTKRIKKDCPNVAAYCERMKKLLYPDWTDVVSLTD